MHCIEILIMMEMDPGNCFQLLDSQASISDQLYCHTMSSYAIHTHVVVPYPCQHSHKEWWSLVTSINYWLLCSTVSNHNLAAVIRKQRNCIGNGRNYISSRQAMIICTLTQEKIEVPALDSLETSILMISAIPANHKNSCCMHRWVGLSAVCIISSLLLSSDFL